MFKITKDGATLAMTEAPNYIKQAENGCFVPGGGGHGDRAQRHRLPPPGTP